jgi:hypothetical protein
MSTGMKFTTLLIAALLCVSSMAGETSHTQTSHSQRKAKKPVLPPPLPSGPQGPVPQIPLDSIPAVAPQVIYQSGQLTILAPNSTLGDILRAVRKQTAADIDIPPNANERVVTSLGPGPAREVVAELLNGSRFNYVLLGSPSDATLLTRVVLVAKTSPDVVAAAAPAQPQDQPPLAGQAGNMAPPPPAMGNQPDVQDADATDDTATDDNADQNAAEAEQQATPPEQPGGIKTPQQMLQEMQQRQLQMQQQIAPGQPPVPGAAIPQQPPPGRPPQQEP